MFSAAKQMKVPLLDLKEQNDALRPAIEEALGRILDTNAFILGGEVAELERELAAYCGVEHAIGCASGSDALLLAMMTLDVSRDDEVITTPYSFFATVSAITRLGARPVFVDIEPDTFDLDVEAVADKISERTKAVQPVHLFGQVAEMGRLKRICDGPEVPIVEDAAQAIGATFDGVRAGAIGAVGCFSFYPSKNLGGMGDGGFLTTNDDELAERLRALRVHGSLERYYHKWVGLNSRLDGFQGAVLRVKLPHLEGWTERRRANAARYREMFAAAGLQGEVTLPLERPGRRHIYNQFVIRVPDHRDALRAYLAEQGIGTDVYYPVPLHLQECFEYLGYREGEFPEAERASRETMALPIYPELTPEQQEYVVEKVAEYFCH